MVTEVLGLVTEGGRCLYYWAEKVRGWDSAVGYHRNIADIDWRIAHLGVVESVEREVKEGVHMENRVDKPLWKGGKRLGN